MLCGETVAVCCENLTEHTDTVHTSQETHHISATEPNRLILCGERVSVRCENGTEHTEFVPHRKLHIFATEPNRLMLFCGNSRCLLRKSYGTHKLTVCWQNSLFWHVKTSDIEWYSNHWDYEG
jgi:hypothetical protein